MFKVAGVNGDSFNRMKHEDSGPAAVIHAMDTAAKQAAEKAAKSTAHDVRNHNSEVAENDATSQMLVSQVQTLDDGTEFYRQRALSTYMDGNSNLKSVLAETIRN